MSKKNLKKKSREKMSSKKKLSLMIIAENAVNLGPPNLARNFDKYFEESLK